ncbi:MAG: phosphatidate cytidylyltransferase [Kiritimatiellia bacterium]|jgi:phosphatidate cytidylyltransferase
MLKKRIVTAVCLFTVFVLSLFCLPSTWFALFIGAVLLVAAWEWASLCSFTQTYQKLAYCLFCAGVATALNLYVGLFSLPLLDSVELNQTLLSQERISSVFMAAGIWWAVALLWVQGYPSSAVLWGSQWLRSIIGLWVLIPSGLALIFLHSQSQGAWFILLAVMVVATADTGAYFSGRAFGRRKLAREVSPGKSWEGVLGGLLACTLLALLVAFLIEPDSWWILLMIVVPTALVSVLGDLLESMLKRHCGLKDSGKLLPGHGGILDRIDGLTAALPVFTLAIILSGWQLG